MKRYMLKVAYDGTVYCGWQVQPNGPTIEGKLNEALTELLGQKIEVIGASRTDSGVHAMGNVCVFDAETRIPADKIKMALNQRLPEDIRVWESCETSDDFHPRHADTVKTYEYNIYNDIIEDPLRRQYCDFCYIPLDTVKMQQAADYIVGEHDFTAFCSSGSSVQDKTRTVYSCEVFATGRNDSAKFGQNSGRADAADCGQNDAADSVEGTGAVDKKNTSWRGREITIRITGNGFLYNMVRIIAGTLKDVGCGRLDPEEVKDIIESKDRSRAGDTAPARGLTLVEIKYV
ncbi:MAG: tRNA pseudouridine(38-40) synthase TruA [Eubacterium sp.]|nr:tRNA pseudouridine(38-40) synthase TruA [Eubacterium sp.]